MSSGLCVSVCGALIMVLLTVPAGAVVQTKQQQKCINAMTKGMDQFVKLGAKTGAKCVSDYGKGAVINAYQCTTNLGPKANAINNRLIAKSQKICKPPLPSFGPTQPADVYPAATSLVINKLAQDAFGVTIDTGLVPCVVDNAKCDCQKRVFAQMTRLVARMSRQFRKCAKAILKGKPPLQQASSLTDVERCLLDQSLSLSVKGSPAIDRAISRFNRLFQQPAPGDPPSCPISDEFSLGINGSSICKNLTGDNLAACLLASVECRVCVAIRTSYDFNLICTGWNGPCS
jgi:hypothetical protein